MDVNYNLPNKDGGSSPQPSTPGAVRYDCEQSLTEEQQQQARENIGAASEDDIPQSENHQLLKDALSEPMGCQANTWHTLCEVTVPEDGVYQVSASVRAQPSTESTYSAVSACIDVCEEGEDPTEHQEIQLPRSGEYGTIAVPIEALRGQKIRLRAYSSSNFYAQAAPSAGKASATFIAAVRIGAIYQE